MKARFFCLDITTKQMLHYLFRLLNKTHAPLLVNTFKQNKCSITFLHTNSKQIICYLFNLHIQEKQMFCYLFTNFKENKCCYLFTHSSKLSILHVAMEASEITASIFSITHQFGQATSCPLTGVIIPRSPPPPLRLVSCSLHDYFGEVVITCYMSNPDKLSMFHN